MIDEQVRTDEGVCLVGEGEVSVEVLAKALKLAPVLVAADGGANAAVKAGFVPEAVIGDLDSVSQDNRNALPSSRIIEVEEQDSTDFEKCLARISAPFIIGVGFTGRRLDHTLAAMSVLARQIGPPTILIDEFDVAFAPRAAVRLDTVPKTRVSLFPMDDVTGKSAGLKWPIDGLAFSPSTQIGTSNVATGPVDLMFDNSKMLVLLPADELETVIAALLD